MPPTSKHWLPILIIAPFVIFLFFQLYYMGMKQLGYEIGTEPGATSRLVEKAVENSDPGICHKKLIMPPQFAPGPAKYDLINGCRVAYATQTGDVSVCMYTINPGSCVTNIAKKRNDPELCKKATDPDRNSEDDRGSCFGYFAAKEKDYSYCERLLSLSDISEGQINACRHAYYDATGDASYYPKEIQEKLKQK